VFTGLEIAVQGQLKMRINLHRLSKKQTINLLYS